MSSPLTIGSLAGRPPRPSPPASGLPGSYAYGSSPLGTSPAGSHSFLSAYGGAGSLYGSSPVTGSSPTGRGSASGSAHRQGGSDPYVAAKKYWKRLQYDDSLEPDQYTVRAGV